MPDLAAGVGITLEKEPATNVLRIATDIVSGRLAFATYADLAAVTGKPSGTVAEVPTSDAGTHTDPVVGGTVNNTGIFSYSTSPAGWKRVSDVDAISAAAFAAAALASQIAAAASEANAAATVSLGLSTATPTQVGSVYDSFTAHNANAFTYSKSAAGTGIAAFPIANLAAGSQVTVAYRYQARTGATPLVRFANTDASLGSTTSVASADNSWRFVTLTVDVGKTANAVRVSTSGAASGTAEIILMPGASASAALVEMVKRSGLNGLAQGLILDTIGMLGGVNVSDQQLKDWTEGESYEATSITFDSTTNLVSSATVKWPGGSAGTFTATATSIWGVDAYTITHTVAGKTVTQAAVTRDSSGNITTKPALTVA